MGHEEAVARTVGERDDPAPIFIIGVGRSGTTLMMAILDAHPDVVLPPETHILRHLVSPNRPATRAEAAEILLRNPYFQRVELEVHDVVASFPEGWRASKWHDVYREMLLRIRERSGKRLVGDKDPKNIEHLPLIRAMYPEAKILQMVRDPRDVLISRMKADWAKGRPLLHHILAYRAQYRLGRVLGRRLFGENYLQVRYERLLANPADTLQEIAAFLDLPYADAMLKYYETSDRLVAGDETQWKRNIMRPLLQGNTGKWRGKVSRWTVLMTEHLCSEVFKPNGPYERSIPRPSGIERCALAALTLLAMVLERGYWILLRWRNRRALRRLAA